MKKSAGTMWVCVVGMVLGASVTGWGVPMGTAVTYQCRLLDGDYPADGEYDFKFKLYDEPNEAGIQVGSTVNVDDQQVSAGLFTVELDFGSSHFDGSERWLQIEVRPGDSSGTYTLLTPRQALTPTPYALYTASAGTLSDWTISGHDAVLHSSDTSGRVHDLIGSYEGWDPNAVYIAGYNAKNDPHNRATKRVILGGSGSETAIVDIENGRVGIGTTSPRRELEVNGDIRCDTYEARHEWGGLWINSYWDRIEERPEYYSDSYASLIQQEGLYGGLIFGVADSGTVGDQITWINALKIDKNGNVGIGTTSPLVKLDLGTEGDVRASQLELKEGWGSVNWNVYWDSALPGWRYRNDGWGTILQMDDTNGNIQLVNYASGNAGNPATGQLCAAAIQPNGNVGIGTTSPNDKLDVNGNININSVYKIAGETVLSNLGTFNIFVGVGAGASNTYGEINTFLGHEAGNDNTEGSMNTFVGRRAGKHNEIGCYNTFLGSEAGRDNTEGHGNTFVGTTAGIWNTTGDKNTFVGVGAGHYNLTGSGNVFIGYDAGYYETSSNKLYIANSDTTTPLIYGDFSTGRVGIGTTSPAEMLHINKSSGSLGLRVSSDATSYSLVQKFCNTTAKKNTT